MENQNLNENQKMMIRQKFMLHPLFSDARRRFLKEHDHQSIKASEKYDEPLNPDSWTSSQLAQHAMQEIVDLSRYTEALRVKAETAADKPNELLEKIQDKLDVIESGKWEETVQEIKQMIIEHFNGKFIPKGGE